MRLLSNDEIEICITRVRILEEHLTYLKGQALCFRTNRSAIDLLRPYGSTWSSTGKKDKLSLPFTISFPPNTTPYVLT
jgi:hypothetical protein